MKRGKRTRALALALGLALCLAGCGVRESGLDYRSIGLDSMKDLAMRIKTTTVPGWYRYMDNGVKFVKYDQETFGNIQSTIDENLETLRLLDYASLTPEEQKEYTIAEEQWTLERAMFDNRLYWEPNGSFYGDHASLPLTLESLLDSDMVLNIRQCVELTEDAGALTDSMLALQQDKAAAGTFMSDGQADEVIGFCRNFAQDPEHIYLIELFNQRIDGMGNLSDAEKNEWKQRFHTAVVDTMAPAYLRLADGLEALKGQGQEGGLGKTEQGAAFYRQMLRYETGSDWTAEEMAAQLDRALQQNDKDWNRMMDRNGGLQNKVKKTRFATSDPDALLEALRTASQADFPEVGSQAFTVKDLNEQIEKNGTGGLFFSAENRIYLSKSANSTEGRMAMTMAHEGCPGHLYQMEYFKKHPYYDVRSYLKFTGYTEGWATYAASYATKYMQGDERTQTFMAVDDIAGTLLSARIEIGVNLEGWDKAKIRSMLKKYNFDADAKAVQSEWDAAITSPTGSLPYVIGYLELMQLQEDAKARLGDAYTDMDFHRAVLDCGPAPFSTVKQAVESYIEQAKPPVEQTEGTSALGRAA